MEQLTIDNDIGIATGPNLNHIPLWVPLVAGGVAGTFTDIALFPIDTIKTRLQSGIGGVGTASGGIRGMFRGVYQGIGPAALASAPAAALFFGSYEYGKRIFPDTPFGHGQAAVGGEVISALFKVPFEVVKQRMQAVPVTENHHPRASQIIFEIYKSSGVRGCYAGLGATLAREIPFGFIQMPIYEVLKSAVVKKQQRELSTVEACGCGAIAGGIAAATTCPVDVWKTRLMLGDPNATILSIARADGIRSLFSGVVPRVVWISVGGGMCVWISTEYVCKVGCEGVSDRTTERRP
jgi:solute carrier family 25 S-adenosylmethionine transporter 26